MSLKMRLCVVLAGEVADIHIFDAFINRHIYLRVLSHGIKDGISVRFLGVSGFYPQSFLMKRIYFCVLKMSLVLQMSLVTVAALFAPLQRYISWKRN